MGQATSDIFNVFASGNNAPNDQLDNPADNVPNDQQENPAISPKIVHQPPGSASGSKARKVQEDIYDYWFSSDESPRGSASASASKTARPPPAMESDGDARVPSIGDQNENRSSAVNNPDTPITVNEEHVTEPISSENVQQKPKAIDKKVFRFPCFTSCFKD